MRRSGSLALLTVPLAGLQGCDSDPAQPVAEVLPVGCLGGWQAVSAPMTAEISSQLAYQDGHIYITLGRGLISMAVSDSSETILSTARAEALWVEGDHLLLNGGAHGTQFFSVPLTGGTPALVTDGTAGRTELGIGQLHTFLQTSTDFFFAESSRVSFTGPTTVWRVPRTGEPPVEIARFTELDAFGDSALYFQGVALAPLGLVLGTTWGVGKFVPLAGGSPRTLAVPDVDNVVLDVGFVGVDARGVYWQVPKNPEVDPNARELVVSPVDGSNARPVWSQIPAFSHVVKAWSDGDDGLVLIVSQFFRGEDRGRTTVWSIDANGAARRRACAPAGAYIDNTPPAIAPDAFYFVAWLENQQMQFIRVPRAAP